MIVDERTVSYIHSLEREDSPVCMEIAREARAAGIPVVRKETASLLKTLVALKRPKQILEVGTAVGYSALLMCQVMPSDCTITTIEKYEKRIPEARRNFARAGESDRIRLIEGDAAEVLSGLDGPYDFIFMDAAKGQYVHFLPQALKLLPPGGLLVSDNVLQDGDVIESRYAVTRRNRTIHTRMREYLYRLKHMEELETAIVPIGDGVTISTRVR
ncbi:MAG: O-methyltransferase [Lachnospiraceae bacterium]|nr:O-methyltransferase [Lachnospiraceae bacterium]